MNKEITQIRREIISADEAAKIIGVTRNTLLRYQKIGLLTGFKVGGKVQYKKEDVINYLTGNK